MPCRAMDDITALKALLVASEGRNLRKQDRIGQLEKLVADFKRALFGARSEKTDPEQFELALEERGPVRHWFKNNGRVKQPWRRFMLKTKLLIQLHRVQPRLVTPIADHCPNIPLPGSRLRRKR